MTAPLGLVGMFAVTCQFWALLAWSHLGLPGDTRRVVHALSDHDLVARDGAGQVGAEREDARARIDGGDRGPALDTTRVRVVGDLRRPRRYSRWPRSGR